MRYRRVEVKSNGLCDGCCFKASVTLCNIGGTPDTVMNPDIIRKTLGPCWDFHIRKGYTYIYQIVTPTLNKNSKTI